MDHSFNLTLVIFYNLIYTPPYGIFDQEFSLGKNRSGCQSTRRCLLNLLPPMLAFGNAWAWALAYGMTLALTKG